MPDWNGGVTDLIEDSTGTIWLMAQMFGPMRRSPDDRWERLAGQRGFPNATFHCMAVDLQGRIWLGSGANRLFRVEPGDQLTRITEKEGVNVGDLMAITPGKGHLWIGGSNGRVARPSIPNSDRVVMTSKSRRPTTTSPGARRRRRWPIRARRIARCCRNCSVARARSWALRTDC